MLLQRTDELLLAETASSAGTIPDRARALLDVLRPVVPFDAAWLALADPVGHGYESLASVDLDGPTVEFLAGPLMARDIELTGTDQSRPPLSPSDLPYPAEELVTWAECLMPVGIVEALAVGLFTSAGQHVGFLALLSGSPQPPTRANRLRLGRLAPVLAHGIDPMRSLVVAAHLVRGATAGAVLLADGSCRPLPGLPGDALLARNSPVLVNARKRLDRGHPYSTFLWPVGGQHGPGGYVRVTVLAAPEDVSQGLTALALLSPSPELHGLTPRELEVLGLVVDGCSNQEIARALVVAPRTVAAHLEHILAKLGTPTRTPRRRARGTRRPLHPGRARAGVPCGLAALPINPRLVTRTAQACLIGHRADAVITTGFRSPKRRAATTSSSKQDRCEKVVLTPR